MGKRWLVDFFDAKVVCLNGFSEIQEFCTFQFCCFSKYLTVDKKHLDFFKAQSLILLDMIYRIKYTNSGCEMFNRGNKGNMNIADSPGGIFAHV